MGRKMTIIGTVRETVSAVANESVTSMRYNSNSNSNDERYFLVVNGYERLYLYSVNMLLVLYRFGAQAPMWLFVCGGVQR